MTRARRSTTITAKQLKPKTLTAAQEKSNGSAVSSSSSSCSSSSSASTSTSSSSSAAPSTPSPKSQYQDAKTLLKRTTVPRRLVGRTAEREKIRQFCEDHILKAQPGSMYISGQPGTGKTALLKEILKDLEPQMMTMKEVRKQDVKIVLVNCMTVKEPRQIYQRLLNELSPATAAAGGKDAVKALEAVLLKTNKNKIMHVVVLDELDNLASKDQEVLYKLFEWSSMEGSKLTLLSISNSLDLVDRLLPRLKARGCEPDLVNFAPYKVEEIREIVVGRLASLGCGDLMERQAIEFCARKVAGATGDLRTVLDICRRAFEIMEAEGKPVKAPLGEAKKGNAGAVLAAANTNVTAGATTMTPKVKVSHIQKALAAAFGSPMVQRMRALGVHHKVVLEVLAKKAQQGPKADECEVGRMFEEYTASCRGRKVAPVSRGEFQDVVGTLEGSGLITMSKAKEVGRRRMGLVVSEKEVLEAVVQKQDQ
ncbi:AAA ATPase [Dissophora globulifera]|nr:AAA ATPase [Dissophora globulifera]